MPRSLPAIQVTRESRQLPPWANAKDHGVPCLLTDDVNLALNGTGQGDLGRLQAPFNSAMRIDEVQFCISPPVYAANSGAGYVGILAQDIAVKLTLCGYELTNGYVPIPNLSNALFPSLLPLYGSLAPNPLPGLFGFELQVSNQTDTEGYFGTGDGTPAFAYYTYYRWRPPHPIYVPPGAALIPQFKRGVATDSLITTGAKDTNVGIGYRGMMLPSTQPKPAVMKVPYVTFASFTGVSYGIAAELTLRNKFLKPMHVQRFTGRNGVTAADKYNGASGYVLDGTVTILGPDGYEVIRDQLPTYTVFPVGQSFAWTYNGDLAPGEGFKVQLEGMSASNGTTTTVGMVGWREEAVR